MTDECTPRCFDEIGYWSEIKLDILRKYAHAYTTILSKNGFTTAYIDGFAGGGVHRSKGTGDLVPGSPLHALRVTPAFDKLFLVDLDGDKVDQLRNFPEVRDRRDVHVICGDCNDLLLNKVLPWVIWERRRRALCVLDPYGLHLDWEIICKAGTLKTVDLFLNFPICDMNRNALWREPDRVSKAQQARMTAFWGDESWRSAAYGTQLSLLGDDDPVKLGNAEVVEAFRNRLKKVAGFSHVPEPIPMRNTSNAVVYYLFFASQKAVAANIITDIFDTYRHRGLR